MSIGFLRFFLSIIVILVHLPPLYGMQVMPGELAVQIFFALSGFYMFLTLDKSYTNALSFYKNRALRIYPLYFVIALISLFFIQYPSLKGMDFFGLVHVIFSNLTLFFIEIFLFMGYNFDLHEFYLTANFMKVPFPAHYFIVIPSSWSLGVEVIFYLIVPFLFKQRTFVLVSIVLCSFGLRAILIQNGLDNNPWTYRFFLTELGVFLLGSLLYRVFKKYKETALLDNKLLFHFAWVTTFTALFFFHPFSPNQYIWYWGILLWVVLMAPILFKFSTNKFDRFLGELSYPIYLSYWFVILGVDKYLPSLNRDQKTMISIFFTLLFSTAIIYAVQAPVDAYRKKLKK